MRYQGASLHDIYLKPSGVTHSLDYEIAGAAIACSVGRSAFESWPVRDQCQVLAYLRTKGRIEAVLSQEEARKAESRMGQAKARKPRTGKR